MAETQLTKNIKTRCRAFRPLINSSNRSIRWAEEVSVLTGVVDVIRFEDYIVEEHQELQCYHDVYFTRKEVKDKDCCLVNGECERCRHYNLYNKKTLGILTTCFEVKITKSDFKSKHGHNFVGNHNYYVVPKELIEDVIGLVSEGIGLIAYYPKTSNMRIVKESIYKEIHESNLSRYLYNAMKKWCDNSFDVCLGLRLLEDDRNGKLKRV